MSQTHGCTILTEQPASPEAIKFAARRSDQGADPSGTLWMGYCSWLSWFVLIPGAPGTVVPSRLDHCALAHSAPK
ncbi:MAG: hypothetical protein AAF236_13140 [Verrucomicrobiota bacterium]